MKRNLFKETAFFLGWTFGVVGHFTSIVRGLTLSTIGLVICARVVNLLAFMLPLKIIMLAGTDGVPRYFRFFIDPDHKTPWIYGLALAAVVAFILTFALDGWIKGLAEKGGEEVLRTANQMIVVKNQRQEVQGFYRRFNTVLANLIFVMAGLTVIALLDLKLFGFIASVLFAAFLVSAWGTFAGTERKKPALAAFICEKPSLYIDIVMSITFILGFLFILYPFVASPDGNIFAAIITLLMMRRTFGILEVVINEAVSLMSEKLLVNTLLFSKHSYQRVESRDKRTLRDMFQKPERMEVVQQALSAHGGLRHLADVRWVDPRLVNVSNFQVHAEIEGYDNRMFLLQVSAARRAEMADNEQLLFSHVTRATLCAPEVVHQFEHGNFRCQIVDDGGGQEISSQLWKPTYMKMVGKHWGCRPPDALIDIYRTSHQLLHERLTEDLVSRVSVAADDEAEAKTVADFLEALPQICARLAAIPLFIVNPDLNRKNVTVDPKGQQFVVTWSRWTLEPLGGGLPIVPPPTHDQLEALLEDTRRARNDIPTWLTLEHLRFAAQCQALEKRLLQGAFKLALDGMVEILESHAPVDVSAPETQPAPVGLLELSEQM